jgi:hypothetical protein
MSDVWPPGMVWCRLPATALLTGFRIEYGMTGMGDWIPDQARNDGVRFDYMASCSVLWLKGFGSFFAVTALSCMPQFLIKCRQRRAQCFC